MLSVRDNFNKINFQFELGVYQHKKVIWLFFPKDPSFQKIVKKHPNTHWAAKRQTWYLYDNKRNRAFCQLTPKTVSKERQQKIAPINLPEFKHYREKLVLKGYSPNTLRTYSNEFAQLLYVIKDFSVAELSPQRLQSYFLYCAQDLKLSENQIHSRMNAVKFYFEQVLHREKMFFDIPRPKKPLLLPKSLSQQEVKRLFQVTTNLKHKLILQLCYGMGLRVSEIVNLKIGNIDSDRMKVLIHRGKGKKDRYVNLPTSILHALRKYYKVYRPKDYLFEGQKGGKYAIRSVQMVFKNAMKKAGIRKNIGVHGLRHSYATHLLEMGTDISLIQKLLGHNNIKTTLLYTHVTDHNIATVQSPLDKL